MAFVENVHRSRDNEGDLLEIKRDCAFGQLKVVLSQTLQIRLSYVNIH